MGTSDEESKEGEDADAAEGRDVTKIRGFEESQHAWQGQGRAGQGWAGLSVCARLASPVCTERRQKTADNKQTQTQTRSR
jgi:hypothetical protein